VVVEPADHHGGARLQGRGGVHMQAGDLQVRVRRQGRRERQGWGGVVVLGGAAVVEFLDLVGVVGSDGDLDLAGAAVPVRQGEGVVPGPGLAGRDGTVAGGGHVVGDGDRGQDVAGGQVPDRDI